MQILQDNIIDTGRKEINENGTINGFKKYAGHECMVLIFPKTDYKPMDDKQKESLSKFFEKGGFKGEKVTVEEINDCPYGATDSGVPGTEFVLSNGEKIWFAHEEEGGCVDIEKEKMYYCNDCPFDLIEDSNACRNKMKESSRKKMRT